MAADAPGQGTSPDSGDIADDASGASEQDDGAETDATGGKSFDAGRRRFSVPVKNDAFIFRLTVQRRQVLMECALDYSKYENQAFEALIRSRVLPVEVVFDELGVAFLVMYVRPMRRFLYVRVGENIPKTLIVLMKSGSIRKICYQPYYLYSLLRLYGVRLKNVFSLVTAARVIHPGTLMCTYSDFFGVYGGRYDADTYSSTNSDFNFMLYSMQGYILLQAALDRWVDGREDYRYAAAVDEVLGASFLRIINLKTNDYLFDLDADGHVIYNKNVDFTARHGGFFVTYTISMDDVPDMSREELYMLGLAELSKKGRFYKYNIQLVTITDGSMILFIGDYEYELIITLLQKFYNHYAQRIRSGMFDIVVSHQRYMSEDSLGVKSAPVLPGTLKEALGMLFFKDDD
jgi:hypothetical protein